MLRNNIPTGLSMPIRLMERIDRERHDVSRSRYILRLLEKIYYQVDDVEEVNPDR